MEMRLRLLRKSISFLWIVFSPCAVPGQTGPESFILEDIKIVGLKNFDLNQAVAASGLHIGAEVEISDLNKAAQKLVDSGFFKSATYKYSYLQRKMYLEFEVKEADSLLSCVFENFVWFDREELIGAIKNRIPLFDGIIPRTGTAPRDAAEALEELLRERRLPGSVLYMASQRKADGPLTDMNFSIDGIRLPIHRVLFPGAMAVSEAVLQEKTKALLGQNYIGSYVEKYVNLNLGPVFRNKGYLRVEFGSPEVSVGTQPATESAVTVAVAVIEGPAYLWDKAEWSGELPFSRQDLDRTLEMQSGEIADESKIDKGLKTVLDVSKNSGYMDIRFDAEPKFNDSARSVIYEIRLTTGPQYRMGTIEFKGLAGDVAGRLHSKWTMKPGSIFNNSYLHKFINSELIGIRYKELKSSTKWDRRKAIIDIVIEFL